MDEKMSVHSSFDGRFYRIDIQQVALERDGRYEAWRGGRDSGEMLLVLYLCDETEILRCKQINNQRLVAGLVISTTTTRRWRVSRRYAVPAGCLIDRKITKYFMAMEGIVKKLENDKYLFVISSSTRKRFRRAALSILGMSERLISEMIWLSR